VWNARIHNSGQPDDFQIQCEFNFAPEDYTLSEFGNLRVDETQKLTGFFSPRVNYLGPVENSRKGVTFPAAVIVVGLYSPNFFLWN